MANPNPNSSPPSHAPGAADGSGPIWREVAIAYVGIAVLTLGLDRLTRLPGLHEYGHLGIACLFLVAAVQLAQRHPGGLRAHGIDLAGLLEAPPPDSGQDAAPDSGLRELLKALRIALPQGLRETAIACGLALLIFPPFALGFYLFHAPSHPFEWRPPEDLANLVVAQLLLVGLPEEALFRGYFQTRLGERYPRRWRLLGASVSPPALLLQAALFALLHFLVDPQPARLAVFFPGLLFGWVRALRGGIGAAIVLHALSNLLSEFLTRGWL